MKKTTLIHSDLSHIIASLGHTDLLTICDCGLPIPTEVTRVDLALKRGTPGFIETLKTVLTELSVEEVIIARELIDYNQALYQTVKKIFNAIEIKTVSHAELKKMTHNSKACVRTGEATAFANIILKSGVVF